MRKMEMTLQVVNPVGKGESVLLASAAGDRLSPPVIVEELPSLKVGDSVSGDGVAFTVVSVGWLPGGAQERSTPLYLAKASAEVAPGSYQAQLTREGWAIAWVTLSDKGAAGKRQDESGPLLAKLVGEKLPLCHAQGYIIPDEETQLKGLLVDLALNQGFDLILTTGGTGVAPRDITPEATLAVIEKRLPGYERAMTSASLQKTPHGAISRAVAGTLGRAVIVNMPGSPKAVAECLAPLLPTFKHTMEKLQGDPSDCATLRQG